MNRLYQAALVAAALSLALSPAAFAKQGGVPAAPAQANGQGAANAHKNKPDPNPTHGNDSPRCDVGLGAAGDAEIDQVQALINALGQAVNAGLAAAGAGDIPTAQTYLSQAIGGIQAVHAAVDGLGAVVSNPSLCGDALPHLQQMYSAFRGQLPFIDGAADVLFEAIVNAPPPPPPGGGDEGEEGESSEAS